MCRTFFSQSHPSIRCSTPISNRTTTGRKSKVSSPVHRASGYAKFSAALVRHIITVLTSRPTVGNVPKVSISRWPVQTVVQSVRAFSPTVVPSCHQWWVHTITQGVPRLTSNYPLRYLLTMKINKTFFFFNVKVFFDKFQTGHFIKCVVLKILNGTTIPDRHSTTFSHRFIYTIIIPRVLTYSHLEYNNSVVFLFFVSEKCPGSPLLDDVWHMSVHSYRCRRVLCFLLPRRRR